MEETRSALETYAQRYGKEITGVWCCFDQLAYIAGDVLQSYGINAIIVGIDGNKETFRRIKEGKMTATIAQPFEEMAKKAIELVEKIVIRRISPEKATGGRKVIYLDAPLVDKSNVSTFLSR
jgi:ABC-type sugar transport system substrate-binding protein